MLPRRHPRGAAVPGVAGDAGGRGSGARQPDRESVAGRQPQSRRFSRAGDGSTGTRRPFPAQGLCREHAPRGRRRHRARRAAFAFGPLEREDERCPEYNFDGLVGPSHNYAGLSFGNVASSKRRVVANPHEGGAAGAGQDARLSAPRFRPGGDCRRRCGRCVRMRCARSGFTGSDAEVLPTCRARRARAAGRVLVRRRDVGRQRRHRQPLRRHGRRPRAFHARPTSSTFPSLARSARRTTAVLRAIFKDAARFAVHDPLPAAPQLRRRRCGQPHALRGRCAWRRASSSSSTAGTASAAAIGAGQISGAANRGSLDRHRPAPRPGTFAHGVRAAESGRDRRGRLPQRRHRRRPGHRAVLSRTGLRRPAGG